MQPLVAKLNWTHICIILPINDSNIIKYYINKCIENNLTKRELQLAIKSKEYERLSESTKEKYNKNHIK